MADLAAQANALENVLSQFLQQTDKLLVKYQNMLEQELAAENRYFVVEGYSNTTAANGIITLTHQINQRAIIDIVNIACDNGKDVLLTIGRFTQRINNTNQRSNILAPLRYEVGPADPISITWPNSMNQQVYMAIFGHYVGSLYG